MAKTRVGIVGYGNLGRGAELALKASPDMELSAIFTRRDPAALCPLTPGVPLLPWSEAEGLRGSLDVLLLCGGSRADLPEQSPYFAERFAVVDSFDTHASITAHFAAVDAAARRGGNPALISCGWDPGLFSLARAYAGAALPGGGCETFWGRGVSQGHSDAIRQIDGVLDARQYTVPRKEAMQAARDGHGNGLTPRQKHRRECWVAAAPGADRARIQREIVTMPDYFADYDTTVRFLSLEELRREHAAMPHGGRVLAWGRTGQRGEHAQAAELSLRLDSNPEFTATVLTAFVRAAARFRREGRAGAFTVLDVPPSYLRPESGAWLRERLL